MSHRACVIGAGPNGLAAAIVLAQAGLQVDVFEAEPTAGGAARTMELTLPGFLHDFGSAVHPFGAGSPFFSSLPLSDYGLHWTHSPAPLAHPLDDGTAVVLESDLSQAAGVLGADGTAWRALVEPYVDRWHEFAIEALRPVTLFPRHPFLMARFGLNLLRSARSLAHSHFRGERARALFAGLAAHSFLSLDAQMSGVFGVMFAISAHAVGWPIPRGGSQALTNALCGYLAKLGGTVKTSTRVGSLDDVNGYDVTLCDITPRQLLQIAGDRLAPDYRRQLASYRYGPGAFKVDYALSSPIPWKAKECLRAATVHIGGSFDDIAASETAMANGQHAERPFMILAQPSLFDPTRAPEGKHVAWVYCHVPNGSRVDMLPRIENQIERFAPGFRDCVQARRVFSPADLEGMDANLIGGDVGGGAMDLRQFLFRPTRRQYATSLPGLYLCSASTPPGGGVHGMCGFHAARLALRKLK
jgi:phytoene dehydrogenase-like protein